MSREEEFLREVRQTIERKAQQTAAEILDAFYTFTDRNGREAWHSDFEKYVEEVHYNPSHRH